MDPNVPLDLGPFQSTIPELTAVTAGLLSVWFMKKEKPLAFPFGIINVLTYVYIFFSSGLYANAAINAFFFIMSVYGWYNWTRRSDNRPVVSIGRCTRWEQFVYAGALVFFFILIRFVLIRFTESKVPSWDGFTTAVYIVAQWLLTQKKIENWLLWISADVIMVGLCLYEGLVFTALQYFVFTLIATLGYREWKTKLAA